MDSLPDELILRIFRCINFTTRLRTLSNVCRRWRRIVMDPSLFRGPLYINDADCNCINGGRNLNQIYTLLTSCDNLRPTQLHIDSRYEEPLECLFNFLVNTSNCNSWKSLTRLSYHLFLSNDELDTCFVTLENFSLQKFIPSVNSNLSELTIRMLFVNTTHMKLICRHLRKLRLLSITCRGMERGCLTYLANSSGRLTELIQLQLRISWAYDRVLYEAALVLEGFHEQLKFLFFWLPRKRDYFQFDTEAFKKALIKCQNLIILGTNLGNNLYPVLKNLPLIEAIFHCDNSMIYNLENLPSLRHLSILSPIRDLSWGLGSDVGNQLLTLSADIIDIPKVPVNLIGSKCPNLVALKLVVFHYSYEPQSIASMTINLQSVANTLEKMCEDLTVIHLSYTAFDSRKKCWYWAVHHPRIILERNTLMENTLNYEFIPKRDAEREMDKINEATETALRKLPFSKQCINCLTNVIFKTQE